MYKNEIFKVIKIVLNKIINNIIITDIKVYLNYFYFKCFNN